MVRPARVSSGERVRRWRAALKTPVGVAVSGYLLLMLAAAVYLDAYGDINGLVPLVGVMVTLFGGDGVRSSFAVAR